MFEVLKWIVELLARVFTPSNLLEARKQKKLAEIGTDLFFMYDSLARVIANGEDILRTIDKALSNYREDAPIYRGDVPLGRQLNKDMSHLRDAVFEQEHLLLGLILRLQKCLPYITVIDTKAAGRLQDFVHEKFGRLSHLRHTLDQYSGGGPKIYLAEVSVDISEEDPESINADVKHTLLDLPAVTLAMTPEIYEALKRYASLEDKKAVLHELTSISDRFRGTILKVFSLQDVLLSVSERIKHCKSL